MRAMVLERAGEPLRPAELPGPRPGAGQVLISVSVCGVCRTDAGYPNEQAAPLLCAGPIGYRALRLIGDAERVGFYGFGAAAHVLCQVAVHQGHRVFAFTREGDEEG